MQVYLHFKIYKSEAHYNENRSDSGVWRINHCTFLLCLEGTCPDVSVSNRSSDHTISIE